MSPGEKPSALHPEPGESVPPFAAPETPDPVHLAVGRKGEDAACRHLWKQGLRILARNRRGRRGEIDIIAERRNRVHFVEVKTRTSDSLGPAEERVDGKKRDLIRETALQYLDEFRDKPEGGYQFDVVSVYLDARGRLERLEWLANAF
jgi:putative endonuclease